MATATPARISIPQNRWKPVIDSTCKIMCPECYVETTSMGVIDDKSRWGCPMCGIIFGLETEIVLLELFHCL